MAMRAALAVPVLLALPLIWAPFRGREVASSERAPMAKSAPPPPAGSRIVLPARTPLEVALALSDGGRRARDRLIGLIRARYFRAPPCIPTKSEVDKLDVRLGLAAENGRVRVTFLGVDGSAGSPAPAEILGCARARLHGDVLIDDPAALSLSSLMPDQVTIAVHACHRDAN
jgi:hypothetical protein